MSRQKRLQAKAVRRILDARTREVVGWLYQWNTGALVPRWKNAPVKEVVYE